MTELEKKQSGRIYDARDPKLRKQQNRAKNLMRIYNNLPAEDIEERNRVLSELLGQFGKNARVNQPLYVDYGYNIHLADNSFINMHCTLLDTAPIIIGENTMIGPDVKIYTAVHALDGAERFWLEPDGTAAVKTWTEPVKIGRFTWIGGGSIILPGVTIGDNVVIGAGSVVTESIPDNAIACGNPCQIKKRNLRLNLQVTQSGETTALS
ncbi:MAG TPA: sugar O-acetyltransferase [Candidatus Gallacutalibacter stercoravium]|nr:sugar O-acetyltransferase [Candidatus Gallacutalibacter stercoravium]